jgi:hypothetical protein
MMIRKSDQPLLAIDSHHQEGSLNKGETLSHSWKLRGQSVGSIGVRALHVKDGNSRVVSEAEFPIAAQRQQSIEVQLHLRSLDEPSSSSGIVFFPTLSIAVDGITTSALEGENFTMLGEFTIPAYATSGQSNFEEIIFSAGNDTNTPRPYTLEAMIVTSKKGADFFVVVLTWKPVNDENRNAGTAVSSK